MFGNTRIQEPLLLLLMWDWDIHWWLGCLMNFKFTHNACPVARSPSQSSSLLLDRFDLQCTTIFIQWRNVLETVLPWPPCLGPSVASFRHGFCRCNYVFCRQVTRCSEIYAWLAWLGPFVVEVFARIVFQGAWSDLAVTAPMLYFYLGRRVSVSLVKYFTLF